MRIEFPYADTPALVIPESARITRFNLPPSERSGEEGMDAATSGPGMHDAAQIVRHALANPIGTPKLRNLARGRESVLVVVDDNSRPTPVAQFVGCILEELHAAGVEPGATTFMMALGTHRPMTRDEMAEKLGWDVVEGYSCVNHAWDDPEALVYVGDTEQGAPVWVNRMVSESDLVIGIGAIMPIDICGFTGGGKILVPGLSGPETVNSMHWTRVYVPADGVVGHADNEIRSSIDALARKAGLHFIINVVLDADGLVVDAVAGDMTDAHRVGCSRAASRHVVKFDREFDVVVADSFPFDIEFWQANKGLDSAGHFLRKGGVIILVTPCYEGWSQTHASDILAHGYRPVEEIKQLVETGEIDHQVVGVHMYQVSEAVVGRGTLILVTEGLPRSEIESVGFEWAATPQAAFDRALELVGDAPEVAVLSNAARMIPQKVTTEGRE